MILITPRPYGLEQLDHIATLEAGRLIKQGTPAVLIAAQGRYYQWQQHGG